MYSCNRYYQAYLCVYDKIKYTTKSFKKNLSVIFKNHSFQFVPFLILSVYFCMDGYKDLISLDVIQYSEKTSANIYKDFDPSSESKIINSLYSQKIIDGEYSQKIIDGDFLTNPKMFNNTEKKLANKKTKDARTNVVVVSDTKKSNPLQVASLNWKNNFTKKKLKFIETLLPLISYQNQKIIVERGRLSEIYNSLDVQKTLHKDDMIFLENMAKKYLVNSKNKHKIDLVEELLQSVDIIPNSIVLAQAANESGWGSSRFAKEHNALFGQYTYDEKNGVVPLRRDKGERYLIRYFSSIDKSVESYFKNINTHSAYEKFRQTRSKMNKKNIGLNVKLLMQHLDVYAKDEFYVETINSIIETNNLMQFDLTNQYFVNS